MHLATHDDSNDYASVLKAALAHLARDGGPRNAAEVVRWFQTDTDDADNRRLLPGWHEALRELQIGNGGPLLAKRAGSLPFDASLISRHLRLRKLTPRTLDSRTRLLVALLVIEVDRRIVDATATNEAIVLESSVTSWLYSWILRTTRSTQVRTPLTSDILTSISHPEVRHSTLEILGTELTSIKTEWEATIDGFLGNPEKRDTLERPEPAGSFGLPRRRVLTFIAPWHASTHIFRRAASVQRIEDRTDHVKESSNKNHFHQDYHSPPSRILSNYFEEEPDIDFLVGYDVAFPTRRNEILASIARHRHPVRNIAKASLLADMLTAEGKGPPCFSVAADNIGEFDSLYLSNLWMHGRSVLLGNIGNPPVKQDDFLFINGPDQPMHRWPTKELSVALRYGSMASGMLEADPELIDIFDVIDGLISGEVRVEGSELLVDGESPRSVLARTSAARLTAAIKVRGGLDSERLKGTILKMCQTRLAVCHQPYELCLWSRRDISETQKRVARQLLRDCSLMAQKLESKQAQQELTTRRWKFIDRQWEWLSQNVAHCDAWEQSVRSRAKARALEVDFRPRIPAESPLLNFDRNMV